MSGTNILEACLLW